MHQLNFEECSTILEDTKNTNQKKSLEINKKPKNSIEINQKMSLKINQRLKDLHESTQKLKKKNPSDQSNSAKNITGNFDCV